MVNPDLKQSLEKELPGKLQKLMFLRVVFVSLLLGASIFIQIKQNRAYFGDIQTSHYLLIAFIYFLTFIYIILYKKTNKLVRLVYFQLIMDTIFVTAIIYSTGGIESIFSFLYILTIITGSIILYRKGGMIIASGSSILYGLLLDLHYYSIIHPFGSSLVYPAEYQRFNIFYIIIVNIAAFYLVAFLSSYPSEQARKSRVELKARQDDILKLEALNEWIIRSIKSGLIALDGEGGILRFNPAAENIFGIKARHVIGKKISEVLPILTNHLRSWEASFNRDDGKGQRFEDLVFSGKDGQETFIRLSVSPLRIPDGDQKGQILFFQDITHIKKIEEEMKKVEGLALIGELAAGIAHEIRNPMASISGSIQVLNESIEKDEMNNRLMEIIMREIDRLNHLVNDFLLFARPKPSNIQDSNLEQLIKESFELFKNSGKWNENMKLEADFQENILIKSDPEQIKQVLWNIFLNATDAMPGGGCLSIKTLLLNNPGDSEPGKNTVKIQIKDSGEGFSEDALTHIFTPFFTTKEKGSGLGLATVKRIIDGLGGTIYGRNHPDGGAEITIFLNNIN
ncbi:MAG: PAS domain S-box protein [Deltaproteobacteria bacterium]|nr:PAS domain S-box protein [Deltaproteobacteria bacterium]